MNRQLLIRSFNLFETVQIRAYSKRVRNILRGKYPFRRKDGTYEEYNETVTIIPKEFEKQDEYKHEKEIAKQYEERYKRHQKLKENLYSLKLPSNGDEKNETLKATCDYVAKSGQDGEGDVMPVNIGKDPFRKKMHQCIFCKYNIPMDYKNVQLLSQFVSPHTGVLYSQEVTGLCHYKYVELENTVYKARSLGLMPFFYKETLFLKDPKLFDPFKNNLKQIPNNYDRRVLNRPPEDSSSSSPQLQQTPPSTASATPSNPDNSSTAQANSSNEQK